MTDQRPERAHSLADTIERIRAEQFPHVDRRLVLELLRLHGDPTAPADRLARGVDELISAEGTA